MLMHVAFSTGVTDQFGAVDIINLRV